MTSGTDCPRVPHREGAQAFGQLGRGGLIDLEVGIEHAQVETASSSSRSSGGSAAPIPSR